MDETEEEIGAKVHGIQNLFAMKNLNYLHLRISMNMHTTTNRIIEQFMSGVTSVKLQRRL
jgi:hypothetical protein